MQFNKQLWEVTPKGAGVLKAKHAASAPAMDGDERGKFYYQKDQEIEAVESQEWSDQQMVDLKENLFFFFREKNPRFLSEHKYETTKRERN